ncbi:MAG TPA: hypothetical protein VGP24_08125, partial [Glaciihabitans sp.]|nr:hypothetical protein [Glaciihabitans sp.]
MAESDLVSAPRVVSEPLVIGAAPRSRFDDVRTIAVLRGGGLGDVIFAIPAMASLAVAYPHAQLTLLGNSAHRELL